MLPRKTPALITAGFLTATLAVAPGAAAQSLPELPGGMSVPDVDLSAPISVPAGQTTTVDLGVPVQVSYQQNGWSVVSSGTSVSVTAPAEGAASASVPVSYAGYGATITLVAEPGTQPPAAGEPAPSDEAADSGNESAKEGASPQSPTEATDRPQRSPRPERDQAKPVDVTAAERLSFDATIEDNAIVVKLGLIEAADLYNRFRDTSRDGLKVRYVDADGGIIKGVERDIDATARTMTLTYPAGESPDNPFIIELVRDDEVAEVIVTLTAPDSPLTQAAGQADGTMAAGEASSQERSSGASVGALTIGAVVLALLAGLVILLLVRRSRWADK